MQCCTEKHLQSPEDTFIMACQVGREFHMNNEYCELDDRDLLTDETKVGQQAWSQWKQLVKQTSELSKLRFSKEYQALNPEERELLDTLVDAQFSQDNLEPLSYN